MFNVEVEIRGNEKLEMKNEKGNTDILNVG
jgi:hypothetical protein